MIGFILDVCQKGSIRSIDKVLLVRKIWQKLESNNAFTGHGCHYSNSFFILWWLLRCLKKYPLRLRPCPQLNGDFLSFSALSLSFSDRCKSKLSLLGFNFAEIERKNTTVVKGRIRKKERIEIFHSRNNILINKNTLARNSNMMVILEMNGKILFSLFLFVRIPKYEGTC